MRRAVILGRVSQEDRRGGRKVQDPRSQVRALRAAADRLAWRVVDVVELRQSAWDETSAREVQERVLEPIRAGRADTIMVWALDRLIRRDPLETMLFINRLEKHYGAALYSLQEPFLSTASDPEIRKLLLPIVAWIAEQESRRRSERVREKVRSKRIQAANLGERATWGRGRLATPKEISTVLEFGRRGRSVREVASRTGLSKSQVQRILRAGAGSARASSRVRREKSG